MTAPTQHTTPTSIDPALQLGFLSLTVSDFERSLGFYTQALGFEALRKDDSSATLGAAGTPLLLLTAQPDAQHWPRGGRSYTGLYHFAILMPTRADLGRWLRHWLEQGFQLPGMGDHLVSEALYLEDPDGHGIEIYADRPRDTWQWDNGRVRMAADPVDVAGLLAEAEREGKPWTGMPAGTTLGHMHLQVGDIPKAEGFYHGILGFDVMARMPSALFISAGGYHHHIGMNTWHSQGAGPAPQDSVKLQFFTINLSSEEARQAVLDRLDAAGIPYTRNGDVVTVKDPWNNILLLRIGSPTDTEAAIQAAQ